MARPAVPLLEAVHEADVEKLKRQCHAGRQLPGSVTTSYRIRHALTGRVSHILEHREAATGPSGEFLGYQGLWLDVTRQTVAESADGCGLEKRPSPR